MLPGDETPGDDARAAISNAWANYYEAREKRRALHDIVRLIWGPRVPSDFDDRMQQTELRREL